MGWTMTLSNDPRSIVQRILAKYLDGHDLEQAVELWRFQYSKKPLQELNYFVFEIATSSTLRNLRNDIVQDLQQGLEYSEIDLSQTLAVKTVQAKHTATQPEPVTQDTLNLVEASHHQALNGLFQQLLQYLKGQNELLEVMQEHLQDSGIDVQYQLDFLHYVQSGEALSPAFYQKKILSQMLNTLYAVLCDYFGPMKSDRYMAQAIAQIDQQYPMVMIKQYL
ncbi:hypothetical protein SAMN05421749_104119 [Acinetobacter marinus]|uniref:Uncharacterized protein n=1 Tax=Acinetobacter marinus TaxID=281375 RepID=A0A1G6KMI1_9GAMM|nr:hypothetical protein [Acinetobacter marinus]SDC32289.1 hypothetical protein SAMN05421749_104119 [Acinetobacter marinus]